MDNINVAKSKSLAEWDHMDYSSSSSCSFGSSNQGLLTPESLSVSSSRRSSSTSSEDWIMLQPEPQASLVQSSAALCTQNDRLPFVFDDDSIAIQTHGLPSTLAFPSTGSIFQQYAQYDDDFAMTAANGDIMAKPPLMDYGFVPNIGTGNTSSCEPFDDRQRAIALSQPFNFDTSLTQSTASEARSSSDWSLVFQPDPIDGRVSNPLPQTIVPSQVLTRPTTPPLMSPRGKHSETPIKSELLASPGVMMQGTTYESSIESSSPLEYSGSHCDWKGIKLRGSKKGPRTPTRPSRRVRHTWNDELVITEANKPFECYPECRASNHKSPAKFKRQEHLRRHKLSTHPGDPRNIAQFEILYCCVDGCRKSKEKNDGFNRNDNLKEHYRTHLRLEDGGRSTKGGRNIRLSYQEAWSKGIIQLFQDKQKKSKK